MDNIFTREELNVPNEKIIINQIRESTIISMVYTILTTGIKIRTSKQQVRTMDILSKFAPLNLDSYLENIKANYGHLDNIRGLTRVMRQLRWLNIIKRTWKGINIEYDEDGDYEIYKVTYDHNHNGDISAVIAAADIITDENELGFYLYFMISDEKTIHKLIALILCYLRTALQGSEIYGEKYKNMQEESFSVMKNWNSNRKSPLMNECNNHFRMIYMFVDNIRQISEDCNSYQANLVCNNVKKMLDKLINEEINDEQAMNMLLAKKQGNDKYVQSVNRIFTSCYLRKEIELQIDIVTSGNTELTQQWLYYTYCDEWLKDKMKEINLSLIDRSMLNTSFQIVAGPQHEEINCRTKNRKQKIIKKTKYDINSTIGTL